MFLNFFKKIGAEFETSGNYGQYQMLLDAITYYAFQKWSKHHPLRFKAPGEKKIIKKTKQQKSVERNKI